MLLKCLKQLTLLACLFGPVLVFSCDSTLIGVYSGTFDPPTSAHKEVILKASQNLNLKSLTIYVNKYTDKYVKAPATARVEMLNQMLKGISKPKSPIFISVQKDPNKRIDYKKIFGKQIKNIVLIIGQDSYEKFKHVSPDKRSLFHHIVVIPRLDDGKLVPIEAKDLITPYDHFLNLDPKLGDVSSSIVREKLRLKLDVSDLIDSNVLSYIQKNHYYSTSPNNFTRFKEYVDSFNVFIKKQSLNLKDKVITLPPFDHTAHKNSWNERFESWLQGI